MNKKIRTNVTISIPVYNIQAEYGISCHEGIIIKWDEDYDIRIIEFINGLSNETKKCIFAVSEHEGVLYIMWKAGCIDSSLGSDVYVCGDVWSIENM